MHSCVTAIDWERLENKWSIALLPRGRSQALEPTGFGKTVTGRMLDAPDMSFPFYIPLHTLSLVAMSGQEIAFLMAKGLARVPSRVKMLCLDHRAREYVEAALFSHHFVIELSSA